MKKNDNFERTFNEEYYGDECGEFEPIEVFGVIVDGNGNVDTSFLEEEDFEGFLTKATNS